jgi:hypothetical protein
LNTLSDPFTPISSISSESESHLIQTDVFRGMHWFSRHASDLKLTPLLTSDADLRITRILVLLSLNFEDLSYTQSYDRYSYITFLLGLDFCSQTGLPAIFAESMAFFLTREFLSLVNIPRMFTNPVKTELHFKEIDVALMNFAPEIMGSLQAAGQGSIHFALRWEMLLFAHEHKIRPLLLIWDQILVNRQHFKDYVKALVFAHVRQIPPARENEIVVEKLQGFRDWEVVELLEDGEGILGKRDRMEKVKQLFVVIVIVITIGLLVIVYVWRGV